MTTTLHPADRLRIAARGNAIVAAVFDVLASQIADIDDGAIDVVNAVIGCLRVACSHDPASEGMAVISEYGADDDTPSTGCPTCDTVIDTLAECHSMSLRGTTAADVAESARDWIGDLIVERDGMRDDITRAQVLLGETFGVYGHTLAAAAVAQACEAYVTAGKVRDKLLGQRDEAHAEVERLRAEVASLRPRPTRDELADYARRIRSGEVDDAPDTCVLGDGWEPGPWWTKDRFGDDVVERGADPIDRAAEVRDARSHYSAAVWFPRRLTGLEARFSTRRAAQHWCEQQHEMADVIAAYTSAPTVGATDAGPDAPALIVEGDAAEGAREACAVPAAPVPPAEQLDDGAGVDRPHGDERIVGPREGEDWIGMGKHAGTSPYGYDVDTSGDDPVLVTNQVEADTMLLLCEWRDAGVSAQTMAKRLNDIGRRTRSGCVWTASSVRSRLLSSGSGYDEWHEVGR